MPQALVAVNNMHFPKSAANEKCLSTASFLKSFRKVGSFNSGHLQLTSNLREQCQDFLNSIFSSVWVNLYHIHLLCASSVRSPMQVNVISTSFLDVQTCNIKCLILIMFQGFLVFNYIHY